MRARPVVAPGPTLSGWGRQAVPGVEVCSESLSSVAREAVLTRGLGRSYGDSALPPPGVEKVAGSKLADRILAFDPGTGLLRAEAGLTLTELNRLFLRRGFFSPVTPGTAMVTLGGMVASDVHGKNHHAHGTIGAHVTRLRMLLADGRELWCSREELPDLFRATVGGMGLTGHILEVELRLERVPSPWIWQESEKVRDIDEYVDALKAAGSRWPFTVGWIDCLKQGRGMGRGILYKGRWAEPHEAPRRLPRPGLRLKVPFELPEWVLGPLTVRAFNAGMYAKHFGRVKVGVVSPESFFYPLDKLRDWNLAYGRRGLTQYQAVLPDEAGRGVARQFLEVLSKRGGASFLCVIKDCGAEGDGLLSFPRPGISVALDIAVRDGTQALIDALNEFVVSVGGRIYLTKDMFSRAEHFGAMEPRLAAFNEVRRRYDPEGHFKSAQSVRLLGDAP